MNVSNISSITIWSHFFNKI